MGDDPEKLISRPDRSSDAALERLFAILRIPSISADPDHDDSSKEAAQRCANGLARVYSTAGNPVFAVR